MSFSAEIRARLGLDTQAFSSGLAKGRQQIDKFGDEVGKTLQRKLGAGDVFRGLLQGLGIASAQQIADKLVAPFKRAAEEAQKLAELSDRVAEANIAAARERLSVDQKAILATQDRVSLESELTSLAAKALPTAEEQRRILQLQLDINRAITTEKKLQVEAAEAAIEASNRALAAEMQAREDFKKFVESRRRPRDTESQSDIDDRTKLSDINRQIADFERQQRYERMTDEQKLAELQRQKKANATELATLEKLQSFEGFASVEAAERILQLKQQQKTLETDITALTSRKREEEVKIGDVIDSNIDKWRNFKGVINSFGRGDKDLSDRELDRKIAELRADVEKRRINVAQGGYDFFLEPQRNNLRQALAEQDFRESIRRSAQFFGEDATFRNNPGLTEQRLRDILQGTTEQQQIQRRTADAVEKLTRLFETGSAIARTTDITPRNPSPRG